MTTEELKLAVRVEAEKAQLAVAALRVQVDAMNTELEAGITVLNPRRVHALGAATATLELVVEALFAPGEFTPAATVEPAPDPREVDAATALVTVVYRPCAKAGP